MRRSVTAALAAAFAILFLPLMLPLLTWKILPFGDFSAFQVPLRFIYQKALRSGDSFLWSSWLGSGLYVHAEGQIGMAHPAHLLMYRILPLTAAVNLEMLGAFAGATAGLWLLLRRLGIRGDAAFGGGAPFGCCLALSFSLGSLGPPWARMMVPSLEGMEKGDAMLHCGIASAGKMVPASRTFRAFDVLVALSGPDKFPSSVDKASAPQRLCSNCLLRLEFDARDRLGE